MLIFAFKVIFYWSNFYLIDTRHVDLVNYLLIRLSWIPNSWLVFQNVWWEFKQWRMLFYMIGMMVVKLVRLAVSWIYFNRKFVNRWVFRAHFENFNKLKQTESIRIKSNCKYFCIISNSFDKLLKLITQPVYQVKM